MKREAAAVVVTFVVTFALVPLIRHLCRRRELFDQPGTLKIHAKPVPRLGGVAIFFGVLAGMLASNLHNFAAHWQFIAALSVIWIAGLIDDLHALPPASRLGAQVLSALLLWLGGWHFPLAVAPLAQIVLLCLFVILLVNSFNFLDGSDGLATGVSCVIAVSYLALPRTMHTPLGFSAAVCMAGACVAFLPFNRYPASTFLGDSGATVLAFLAAFIGLDFANTSGAPKYSIVLALAIAAPPIFDALRVVMRRIARRVSPMSGDRHHFYDELLAKGWTPQAVVLVACVITASCGAIAVCIVRLHASIAWSLAVFVVVTAFIDAANSSHARTFAADCEAGPALSDCDVIVKATKSGEASAQESKEL